MNDPNIYIQNGSDATSLSFDASNNTFTSMNQTTGGEHIVTFWAAPSAPALTLEPTDNDFFLALHKAYAALPADDRHELNIWDATLEDGLDED